MRSNVSVGTTPRQKWTACESRTGVHSFDTRRTSVEMPSPSCISSVTSPFRKLPSAYSPSTAGPEIPLRKHCLLSGRTIDQSPLPCLRKRGIAAQVIPSVYGQQIAVRRSGASQLCSRREGDNRASKVCRMFGTYNRDGKGFHGDVTGSDKSVGFSILYNPKSD